MSGVIRKSDGISFRAGNDTARLLVAADDTNGRYSLLEWWIAPGKKLSPSEERHYGPHLHRGCEETFLIQSGELEFLIGEEVALLQEGDFVRVPPGVRHGYQNTSGQPVDMLVSFTPGGFEQLFLKYRTDQDTIEGPGFITDARRYYDSEFGL